MSSNPILLVDASFSIPTNGTVTSGFRNAFPPTSFPFLYEVHLG